tara:strand:+ start:48 stop:296 length:249 start_codon:yes stop_codon:yes gene_type:complete
MNPFDEENFSGWGMPNKTNKEEEYPEQYNPPSRTEQINELLDDYLDRKANLDRVKGKKGAEQIEKIYQKILDNLGNKLNEIK